jgi:hypothetical protein
MMRSAGVTCLTGQENMFRFRAGICSTTRFVSSISILAVTDSRILLKYIVYDPSQIRLRYLLMVNMN